MKREHNTDHSNPPAALRNIIQNNDVLAFLGYIEKPGNENCI